MVKICPNCGLANEEKARFCKKCGTKLDYAKPVKNNAKWMIIFSTIAISVIIIFVGIIIANTDFNQSSLIMDEPSTYYESDILNVHLYDKDGYPVANEPIQLKLKSSLGVSTILSNSTDANGNVSFSLDFASGDYFLSIHPTSSRYSNMKFEKDIFIEKSGLAMYDEDFAIRYDEYLVKNQEIYLDMDSYNFATLQGYDEEGNDYIWIAGYWWKSEDINNGNVAMPV